STNSLRRLLCVYYSIGGRPWPQQCAIVCLFWCASVVDEKKIAQDRTHSRQKQIARVVCTCSPSLIRWQQQAPGYRSLPTCICVHSAARGLQQCVRLMVSIFWGVSVCVGRSQKIGLTEKTAADRLTCRPPRLLYCRQQAKDSDRRVLGLQQYRVLLCWLSRVLST
ncbi:unnamed protein product, partial [Ectocarpus fasciculatus]